MIGRKVRLQIALFLIIAVVGIGYAGAEYVGVGRYLGVNGYTVTARLADGGGVFTNAEVTYRGVSVGRVTAMDLTDDGVAVRLHVKDSAPPIPADAHAVVADRSAVGEQYIDLRPSSNQPPYLADGSVIPEQRTQTPPAPASVLQNLNTLVGSIPPDSLGTVVDELGTAFQGTGPSLQRMLDGTNSFLAEANQHVPQTKQVLANSGAVLDAQHDQAAHISQLGDGLQQISAQLKESDPDVRTTLHETPQVGQQVDDLVRTTGNDMSTVLGNLLTTMNVVAPRNSSIQQLLTEMPVISSLMHSIGADGTGHLGATLNVFNPKDCEHGYESTPKRRGDATSQPPQNTNIGCAEPPGSPTSVRGSQNAPRAGNPVEVPQQAAQSAGKQDSGLPLPLAPK